MNKVTEPIRSKKKVAELLAYLKGHSYRNFLIAKVQLNTARRISDVVDLRVCDVIAENGHIRKHIGVTEKKTSKGAMIGINAPLGDALMEYIREEGLSGSDYLFKSRKGKNKPISTTQAHRIFQDAGAALHIEDFGTHSLRKTWGYFCYKETNDIALIMQVLNHSSEKITLRYIGITQKEMDKAYMSISF